MREGLSSSAKTRGLREGKGVRTYQGPPEDFIMWLQCRPIYTSSSIYRYDHTWIMVTPKYKRQRPCGGLSYAGQNSRREGIGSAPVHPRSPLLENWYLQLQSKVPNLATMYVTTSAWPYLDPANLHGITSIKMVSLHLMPPHSSNRV